MKNGSCDVSSSRNNGLNKLMRKTIKFLHHENLLNLHLKKISHCLMDIRYHMVVLGIFSFCLEGVIKTSFFFFFGFVFLFVHVATLLEPMSSESNYYLLFICNLKFSNILLKWTKTKTEPFNLQLNSLLSRSWERDNKPFN